MDKIKAAAPVPPNGANNSNNCANGHQKRIQTEVFKTAGDKYSAASVEYQSPVVLNTSAGCRFGDELCYCIAEVKIKTAARARSGGRKLNVELWQ